MTNQQISVVEKYAMLRCLIAIAHADGVMHPEEVAYILAFMNRIPFTAEQAARLQADIDTAQNIDQLFAQINNPVVRAQVLYFARILAYRDGLLHPTEDDILKRLHLSVTSGLDMDAIRTQVRATVASEMDLHDIRIDQNRPKSGGHVVPYLYLLDRVLLKLGLDLLR